MGEGFTENKISVYVCHSPSEVMAKRRVWSGAHLRKQAVLWLSWSLLGCSKRLKVYRSTVIRRPRFRNSTSLSMQGC